MKEIVYMPDGIGLNRIRQLKLLNILLLLKCCHELYLTYTDEPCYLVRLINCDYLVMANLEPQLHFISFIMLGLTIYVYYLLYFYNYDRHFVHLSLLGPVIFEKRNNYILPPIYGQKRAELKVLTILHNMFVCAHLFSVIIGVLFLAIQLHLCWYFLQHLAYFFSTIVGFLALLLTEINFVWFIFALLALEMGNMIGGVYTVYFTCLTFIRLRQINERFLFNSNIYDHRCGWNYYRRFARYHTQTLLYGITYGQFGSVSTYSFLKCLGFYLQFLIYCTYKMFGMTGNFRLYFITMKEIVYVPDGIGLNRVRQLKLMNILIFMKVCHELYLTYTNEPNYFVRLLNCDYLNMANLAPQLHLISLIMFGLTIYVYYTLYFYNYDRHFVHLNILGQVLFEKRNNYLFPPNCGQKPPELKIRTIMYRVFFYAHMFSVVIGALFLAIQLHLCWYFLQHLAYFFSTIVGFLAFLLIEANFAWFIFALLSLEMGNMIGGAYTMYFTFATFVRLRQINERFLFNPNIYDRRSGWHYYRRFARYHTQTLLVIFSYNKIFGEMLTGYLVLNFPVNSYLWLLITNGRISTIATIFYSFLILGQSFFIFVEHLMAAMFTHRIHSVAKPLMHINIHNRCCVGRFKLQLTNYILKFHCENKYGITYGQFGSVSTYSFLKF
ncbi:hypothetical protein RDWZM_000136 [Blomia tropicalis]|uniref:Uncharacterized protein n=1 Tax=Blomia tropicalis TaxID=40697 RepID=A0A9Q0RQ63_BLOTA|nr:hypothetical protein RDWZM_000136 [Blomia tropicalis]